MKNTFFKPTKMYKEYAILNMIDENLDITQRKMSESLNIAVSMVNAYLDAFEEDKLIIRDHKTRKTVNYHLTKKGNRRKNYLNIQYLSSTQKLYNLAEAPIIKYLKDWHDEGIKSLVLYGAGEVAEILLNTYFYSDIRNQIKIELVIDDDPSKHGKKIYEIPIKSISELNENHQDALLITAYSHQHQIQKKLKEMQFNESKIKTFF